MGPAHFGGGIGAEAFGVDRFVRGLSLDAQSLVSCRLTLGAASAGIRPPEIARSVRIAATLLFGFVGYDAFGIAIDVRFLLRSGI